MSERRDTEITEITEDIKGAEDTQATGSGGGGDVTVVHLMRHGEVENPTGVLYGRLP
ncbi:histidine phosphatase family protein, partial [Streptomyces sp. SID625]|nr:histidine phosphatase family protein [Streptomyces sp. SID625]